MSIKKIKIGTRGSPLALAQTHMTCKALKAKHPNLEIEIIEILTSGDWKPEHGETRLSEKDGGKGLFAKEIEHALLNHKIDAAIHSMKDMDSHLPQGLIINHMLPREDPRDTIVFKDKTRKNIALKDLQKNLKIGTSSVRRAAFLKSIRPDFEILPIRGNVQTRLDKLYDQDTYDATLLACAGLKRLGLENHIDTILQPATFIPAAGQGAVGIEIRESEPEIAAAFESITCIQTLTRVTTERAALKVLDGSCHTPIGAHAELDQDSTITFNLAVTSLDGTQTFTEKAQQKITSVREAQNFGEQVGALLKSKLPKGFLK